MIAAIDPGEKITVTVNREGSERDISVTLGNLNDFDREQQQASAQPNDQGQQATPSGSLEALGLTVEQNPDGGGVRVTGVQEDSPAADRGLQEGDVIVAVGSQTVNSIDDVEKGISNAQDRGRDAVLFRVQGENGTRFVGVPFERG
jgi:serine protease Do